MLVKLTSSSSGEITMFSDVAHRLFEIAGKKCTARGVFTKEQLPDTIDRLNQAVDAERAMFRPMDSPTEKVSDEEKQTSPRISLAQRAYPFLALTKLTQKEEGFLTWEAANDF